MLTIVAVAVLMVNGTSDTRRYRGPVFETTVACDEYRLSGDNSASVEDLSDYLFDKISGLQSVTIVTVCETDGDPA